MCGKPNNIDCSCDPSCTSNGTCCSDYYECEELQPKTVPCNETDSNCEICLKDSTCGQCKDNLYLQRGQCVDKCSDSFLTIEKNKVCYRENRCLVDNCLECEEGNPSVCKRCLNGLFLSDNQCKSLCPVGYKADRMNWLCLDNSIFGWYWVFPSQTTCKGACDVPSNNINRDCSCTQDCFRYGNCCQDVEEFCYRLTILK
jgi:hypothetical protein